MPSRFFFLQNDRYLENPSGALYLFLSWGNIKVGINQIDLISEIRSLKWSVPSPKINPIMTKKYCQPGFYFPDNPIPL